MTARERALAEAVESALDCTDAPPDYLCRMCREKMRAALAHPQQTEATCCERAAQQAAEEMQQRVFDVLKRVRHEFAARVEAQHALHNVELAIRALEIGDGK